MESVRYLIAGAGITGLAFADRIGKDESYLVLEADREIGGYCKTIRKDGFVWDYSGHFFHFRHPSIEAELVGRMGNQKVLRVRKDSRIHWPGAEGPFGPGWIDFPFQKNIHQLPRADFVECLHDLYFRDAAQKSAGPTSGPPERPQSFREMLYARFGKGIAERFLVPYNEKLYATDLGELDVDAMGRFFPHADLPDVIRNMKQADNASYNATFTYPEGGAIQYVHALAAGVEPGKIALGERLAAIDLRRKVARTERATGEGREIRFEHLVSSAPFVELLRAAGLAHDEGTYSFNQVLVFNLGFDRKGPGGVHWAYYPQRDVSFYRVGFYDNIFGSERMSLYVELGYPRGAVIDDEEIARAKERALRDLGKVGVLGGQTLVAEHHVVMSPAYVHITKASIADVEAKRATLASRGVHSAGRYGGWTYCSIEDNVVEARALADRLTAAWQ